MKKLVAAAVLCCALLAAGTAGATTGRSGGSAAAKDAPPLNWGVADDASKYADDGGKWFYGEMAGAHLVTDRWTLAWDSSHPTAITELPFIQRAAPVAQAAGIHVVLALYSGQNGTSTPDANDHDPNGFCSWAKLVAQTVKPWGIRDFIIGNEPSSTLYWAPQKDASGNDVGAPAYEALLANCYDQLHSLDGGGWKANVIGMGLSAKAAGQSSNQPLDFLRDVGAAYKASGRSSQAPIMDQLALHPYPLPAAAPSPDKGYTNTPGAYGPPDLDRVKQAVYDAFNGTDQPTTLNGLTFRLDEFGWQSIESGGVYTGSENAGPPGSAAAVDRATQAQYLQQAAAMFACDATVSDVELFLLVDEPALSGWQSGLLTAGGQGVSQAKPAYSTVASFDQGNGRSACTTGVKTWSPAGSSGASSGGSGGTTSADQLTDLQNLSKLFDNPTQVQQALNDSLAGLTTQLVSGTITPASFVNALHGQLNLLLRSFGTAKTDTKIRIFLAQVNAGGGSLQALLKLARGLGGLRLSSLHLAGITVVASGAANVKAGNPLTVKLTPKAGVKKLAAGTYYAATVITSATDNTASVGVVTKVATVTAKASKKGKKGGQGNGGKGSNGKGKGGKP